MSRYLDNVAKEAQMQLGGTLLGTTALPIVATLANGDNTLGQKIGGSLGALAPILVPRIMPQSGVSSILVRAGLPITTSLLGRYLGGLVDPQRTA